MGSDKVPLSFLESILENKEKDVSETVWEIPDDWVRNHAFYWLKEGDSNRSVAFMSVLSLFFFNFCFLQGDSYGDSQFQQWEKIAESGTSLTLFFI